MAASRVVPDAPLTPVLVGIEPGDARRLLATLSCHDCDPIPKVERAGQLTVVKGVEAQIMHNGVLIEKDCYGGPWQTELIRCMRGHHEPQEELVFHRMIERLAATEPQPTMVELGSWWAYYSLWFKKELPGSSVLAMEPDPEFLDQGRRNFDLNDLTATFIQGGIGPSGPDRLQFHAPTVDRIVDIPRYELRSLMSVGGLERISLLLADIQGPETDLVEQGRDVLAERLVRFMLISTHHHSISGDAMTHQRVLATLRELGAHVIAEHTVGESYSGDGLVAVSFDDRDRDMVVPISYARNRESLYGELEPDLEAAQAAMRDAEARAETAMAAEATLRAEAESLQEELAQARTAIAQMRDTRLWRLAQRPRVLYARMRGREI